MTNAPGHMTDLGLARCDFLTELATSRLSDLSGYTLNPFANQVTPDLSRPRDQLATKEHPDFLAYRHRVYQLLRSGP